MTLQKQIPNLPAAMAFRRQITNRVKITKGLAHLFPFDEQVRAMHPVLHKWPTGRLQPGALALRDLVFVMWKRQVLAAHMQVEAGAEDLHAHRTALDVPAGTPFAPWARPEHIA